MDEPESEMRVAQTFGKSSSGFQPRLEAKLPKAMEVG